jgi:hypothetical protein
VIHPYVLQKFLANYKEFHKDRRKDLRKKKRMVNLKVLEAKFQNKKVTVL